MTNPLVEYMSKGKSSGEDYGGDLHTRKSTHISIPTEAAEFHFSSGELNMPATDGERYKLCFDVVCSSSDDHDVRFKQYSRPYLEPYSAGNEKEYSSPEKDAVDVRTQESHSP